MWVDGLTVTFEKFTTTWKKSDHTTIVALFRGHIVGIVMVEYIGGDRLQAMLWNLQTDKEMRRQKIGKKLLDQAEADAAGRGCNSISLEWRAIDSDGWVLDWYKRNGYKVSEDCYRGCAIRITKKLKSKRHDKD